MHITYIDEIQLRKSRFISNHGLYKKHVPTAFRISPQCRGHFFKYFSTWFLVQLHSVLRSSSLLSNSLSHGLHKLVGSLQQIRVQLLHPTYYNCDCGLSQIEARCCEGSIFRYLDAPQHSSQAISPTTTYAEWCRSSDRSFWIGNPSLLDHIF